MDLKETLAITITGISCNLWSEKNTFTFVKYFKVYFRACTFYFHLSRYLDQHFLLYSSIFYKGIFTFTQVNKLCTFPITDVAPHHGAYGCTKGGH